MAGPTIIHNIFEIFIGAHQHSISVQTEWFNEAVYKSAVLATPGIPDFEAMGPYGAINVSYTLPEVKISVVHLHQTHDGNAGVTNLELYRKRSGVFSMLATVSLSAGNGDDWTENFVFANEEDKVLNGGDYLYLQATSKMSGNPMGYVDIHYDSIDI